MPTSGTSTRAAELIAAGPPFELGESGIFQYSIYLSSSEVIFVFEGHQVEWIVDDLVNEPFHYRIYRAPTSGGKSSMVSRGSLANASAGSADAIEDGIEPAALERSVPNDR